MSLEKAASFIFFQKTQILSSSINQIDHICCKVQGSMHTLLLIRRLSPAICSNNHFLLTSFPFHPLDLQFLNLNPTNIYLLPPETLSAKHYVRFYGNNNE